MSKLVKHRLNSGIAEKMDAALPPASGGVIAVYDSDGAEAVGKALANAVKTSVAHIDSLSAKQLKAGLAEAQAGMGADYPARSSIWADSSLGSGVGRRSSSPTRVSR